MRLITVILMSAAVLMSTASVSAKKSKANKGEKEVEQLCNYYTDENDYYGNGIAESTDMQMAKDKAITAARAQVANTLKMSIEQFTKRFRSDVNDELDQKTEDNLQSITVQTMSGCSVVCERVVRAENGKYRAYVSVKLPKQKVIEEIKETVKKDTKKSLDEREEEFNKAIRESITNSGN